MPVEFRNVDASPTDDVRTWPYEALVTVIDRVSGDPVAELNVWEDFTDSDGSEDFSEGDRRNHHSEELLSPPAEGSRGSGIDDSQLRAM